MLPTVVALSGMESAVLYCLWVCDHGVLIYPAWVYRLNAAASLESQAYGSALT